MSVDRSGEMPRITVDVPELLALGLMLQSKREELGDTYPLPGTQPTFQDRVRAD